MFGSRFMCLMSGWSESRQSDFADGLTQMFGEAIAEMDRISIRRQILRRVRLGISRSFECGKVGDL